MSKNILVINPGSTSTKVAIFRDQEELVKQTLRHQTDDLKKYKHIINQKNARKALILAFLEESNYRLEDMDIFVGRGGMLKPLKKSGTYLINNEMLDDLTQGKYGEHASNLGAILAFELAQKNHKKAYIVDPVSIDEMDDIARVSGLKGMERKSTFHALNQKGIARKHAAFVGKPYESLCLIVCHLGGGISVGLHDKGRVIDVNNALGGDGPFSPERTGTIPTYPLVDLCFSKQYTIEEIKKLLVGHGGLISYLGTSNAEDIENRIKQNDQEAENIFKAMAYNIVKAIGSLYFIKGGQIDDILITGGLAYNKTLMAYIKSYMDPIKQVYVYPGEVEMEALALGALRVIHQKEAPLSYKP